MVKVVNVTEIILGSLSRNKGNLSSSANIFRLAVIVLHQFFDEGKTNLFLNLDDRFYGCEPMFNHKHLVIKSIAKKYLTLRIHYLTRNAVDQSSSKIHLFHGFILFFDC